MNTRFKAVNGITTLLLLPLLNGCLQTTPTLAQSAPPNQSAIQSTAAGQAVVARGSAGAAEKAAPPLPSTPRRGGEYSVEQAFFDCSNIGRNSLAVDLMKTIFEAGLRQSINRKYAGTAGNYKFTPTKRGEETVTATIDLTPAVMIAGVQAKQMTAITCEQGCGWNIRTLEFGPLSAADGRRVSNWAAKARAASKQNFKVEASTHKGRTFLMCDVTHD